MKVSKDLIERYHQGLCSPDEREAVEQWLLEDEDTSLFPMERLDKKTTKEEIWEQLQRDIIQANIPQHKSLSIKRNLKSYASAAAVVLFLLAAFGLWNREKVTIQAPQFAQNEKLTGLNTELFDIELGNESQATFDRQNDLVDFCGMIKITPKKSMKLSFSNFCGSHEELRSGYYRRYHLLCTGF